MKSKLIKYMVLSVALFTSVSCNSWFDVSPKSNVKLDDLFSTESGFRDVLIGSYSVMATPSLYGREMTWGLMDVLAGYYPAVVSNIYHDYYYSGNYDYDEREVEELFYYIWSYSYKAITNVNAIVSHIDSYRDSFVTESNFELTRGEAHALRAFLHFDLCRLFGAIPTPKNMGAQAVPYMTEFSNVAKPALSMADFYTQTLKDLDIAIEAMREYDIMGPNYNADEIKDDELDKRRRRMNYYAAVLLKARVAQYFGDKATAMKAVREVIPTADAALPAPLELAQSSSDKYFNKEQLFMLDMVDFEEKLTSYFGENAISMGGNAQTPLTIATGKKDTWYAALSASDNDYRLSNWFTGFDADNDTVDKFANSDFIPLLHSSEFYYIAAECAANDEERYAYFNEIRAHRGLAPITSYIEEEIRDEVHKEYMGEGQAFFYIKRVNSNSVGPYYPTKTLSESQKVDILCPDYPADEVDYGKVTL